MIADRPPSPSGPLVPLGRCRRARRFYAFRPRRRRRRLAYNGRVSTPFGSTQDQPVPTRIHADRQAGTLAVDWLDGHHTVYDFVTLRWLCPCAYCRGEAGLPGWLDSKPTLTSEQTRLVDIQLVGQYAVQPTWGDGHHTGYYTFAVLRDRCSCGECAARRATTNHEAATSGHLAHSRDQ